MKSSQAKIEANRQNAQRSTGPRTSAGKAASSRNAIRTGLATMTVTVMPGESQQDLDKLTESIRGEWNPSGDHENFLVDQMISLRWRLERLTRWEAEAIDKAIEAPSWYDKREVREWETQSADRHVVDAIAGSKSSLFDKLERYTRAAERAYSKAVKELETHRAAAARTAKQNEATAKQNKAKEAEDWLQSELAKLEQRGIPDPMAGLWKTDQQPAEPFPPAEEPVPSANDPGLCAA